MAQHQISVLGLGDNVVDKYEHIKTMYPDGNCVNLAIYAQMFGVEGSAYTGRFGSGAEVEYVVHTLEEISTETMKCRRLEGKNGCTRTVLVDGDRVFLGSNEGGIRGGTPSVLDRFDTEHIRRFDLAHSGNYCFTEVEFPEIKAVGASVPFDFSDDSTEEYYQEVAPSVDYAFCSLDGTDEEARRHLKQVVSHGPKPAVISRGTDGCILYDGKDLYMQKAAPIENVVDIMGAGDSLITSFMAGYTDHLKKGVTGAVVIQESPEEAAKLTTKICRINGALGYGKVYK